MTEAEPYRSVSRADRPSSGRAVDLRAGDRLLIVVRHGDAGSKENWNGPDRLRPLASSGRRQAEGLVLRLEDYPVEQILSSPAVRCQQTIQPLAEDRSLPVEPVAQLDVDAGPDQLRTILLDRRLHQTVLCTHGETISQLFALLVMEGLMVQEPLQWPKGSTWLLQHTQVHVRARYLPPLELDPRHARWRDHPAPVVRGGVPSRQQYRRRRSNRPIEQADEPRPGL